MRNRRSWNVALRVVRALPEMTPSAACGLEHAG